MDTKIKAIRVLMKKDKVFSQYDDMLKSLRKILKQGVKVLVTGINEDSWSSPQKFDKTVQSIEPFVELFGKVLRAEIDITKANTSRIESLDALTGGQLYDEEINPGALDIMNRAQPAQPWEFDQHVQNHGVQQVDNTFRTVENDLFARTDTLNNTLNNNVHVGRATGERATNPLLGQGGNNIFSPETAAQNSGGTMFQNLR